MDWAGRTVQDEYTGEVGRAMTQACATQPSAQAERIACVNRLGIHDVATIQPASRFCALQGLETVSFLPLATVLDILCYWWVRHRTS